MMHITNAQKMARWLRCNIVQCSAALRVYAQQAMHLAAQQLLRFLRITKFAGHARALRGAAAAASGWLH